MLNLLPILLQIADWPIDTTYNYVLVGVGIVSLILILVYIALYSSEES